MSNRPAWLHIPEQRLVTGFPKEEASSTGAAEAICRARFRESPGVPASSFGVADRHHASLCASARQMPEGPSAVNRVTDQPDYALSFNELLQAGAAGTRLAFSQSGEMRRQFVQFLNFRRFTC